MDRRSIAHQFRFLVVFAVIDHQREVDIAIRQVPQNMPARAPRSDLTEPEHVFVEPRRCLQVAHFERQVIDPRYVRVTSRNSDRSLNPYTSRNPRRVSFNLTGSRLNRQRHTSRTVIYSHVEPHILRHKSDQGAASGP